MKLRDAVAQSEGIITSLGEDVRFIKRITAMGITEGTTFEVVKNDKHMPMLIYARETLLALNPGDCEKIIIRLGKEESQMKEKEVKTA